MKKTDLINIPYIGKNTKQELIQELFALKI